MKRNTNHFWKFAAYAVAQSPSYNLLAAAISGFPQATTLQDHLELKDVCHILLIDLLGIWELLEQSITCDRTDPLMTYVPPGISIFSVTRRSRSDVVHLLTYSVTHG